jgi:hypothetical protein
MHFESGINPAPATNLGALELLLGSFFYHFPLLRRTHDLD